MSLPVRGAWIEIGFLIIGITPYMSLPVRGAWIEINYYLYYPPFGVVAPRAGSVD